MEEFILNAIRSCIEAHADLLLPNQNIESCLADFEEMLKVYDPSDIILATGDRDRSKAVLRQFSKEQINTFINYFRNKYPGIDDDSLRHYAVSLMPRFYASGIYVYLPNYVYGM